MTVVHHKPVRDCPLRWSWYMYSHQFTMQALLFHSVIHTRTSSPDQHQVLLTNQKGCYLQRCSPNKCWRGPGQTPREPYVLFDCGTIAPIKMFPALCTYFNDLQIIILLHMPLMARSILLFPINQFNSVPYPFKIALQQRWLSPSIFVIKNIVLQSFLPQQLTGRKQRNVKKNKTAGFIKTLKPLGFDLYFSLGSMVLNCRSTAMCCSTKIFYPEFNTYMFSFFTLV